MKSNRIYLRIAALMLCAVMMFAVASVAYAADTIKILRGTYEVRDNKVLIYGKDLPAGGTLTVSSDKGALTNVEISNVQAYDLPMTLYCLVDASSSVSLNQRKMQQDALKTIASQMRNGDAVICGYIDDELVESKVMTTKEAVAAAADTIAYNMGTWYTNLFQGIQNGLRTLRTVGETPLNRAMLVLADGDDNGQSSITEPQMILSVQEARLPVYTIAVTTSTPPGYAELESAKNLKRCSEESLGGTHQVPASENISAAAAAERVLSSIRNAAVFVVDMDELEAGKDNALMVRYEVNGLRYEDTITIYAADIIDTGKDKGFDFANLPVWAYIIAAAVVVLLIVAIIFIVKKKKNQDEEPEVQQEPMVSVIHEEPTNVEVESVNREVEMEPQMASPISMPSVPPVAAPAANSAPRANVERCKVRFVALMHPEVRAETILQKGKSEKVGRVAERSSFVLNGNDANLSSRHFEMEWDGKAIYIRDLGSTNGTAVNSSACVPNSWVKLENGATLRAGNYEYRVQYQKV